MKCFKSLLTLVILYVFTGCAGLPNHKDAVDTIILTSNFSESRALAEHLQVRNNQLIMEFPHDKSINKIYVKGPNESMMVIDDSSFSSFIDFSGAKHVIVLGNALYVPDSYLKRIHPSIKTYSFDDKDWRVVAWQVEDLTGFSGLAEDYINDLKGLIRIGKIEGYFAPSFPSEPQAIIPGQ